MKKQTLHALGALTLFLVLTALFAACDDGYEPKAPFISFNKTTLYLTDVDEDDNLLPLKVTVSIPSKLKAAGHQYRVVWAVSVVVDDVETDIINKIDFDPPFDDDNYHEGISQTETYNLTPQSGVTTFTVKVKVFKLVEGDIEGTVKPEDTALVEADANITVKDRRGEE